jgi:hypothetical protein
LNPDVPAELKRIVNKALEKDRDIRCQSAAELRADLRRLKRDTESQRITVTTNATSVTPAIPFSIVTNRKLLWFGALFAIVIAVLGG